MTTNNPRLLSLAAVADAVATFASRARVQRVLGLAQDVDALSVRLRAEGGLAAVAATLGELADQAGPGAGHLRDAFGLVNAARAERAVAFELRSETPPPGVEVHLERAAERLGRAWRSGAAIRLEPGDVEGAKHSLAEAQRLLREARISRADGTRPSRVAELSAIEDACDAFAVFRDGAAGEREAQAVAVIRRAVRRIREVA